MNRGKVKKSGVAVGGLASDPRNHIGPSAHDLTNLELLDLDALRSRWGSVYGIQPLPRLSRELLIRGIAF